MTKITGGVIDDGAVGFTHLLSSLIATKNQAEIGAASDKLMTPQRTKEAIEKLAFKWGDRATLYKTGDFAERGPQGTVHAPGLNLAGMGWLNVGGNDVGIYFPYTYPPSSTTYVPIMRSPRLQLLPGDLIIAFGQLQVTSALSVASGLNMGVWTQLVLNNSDSNNAPDGANSFALNKNAGGNITPGMHHEVHVRAGMLVSPVAAVMAPESWDWRVTMLVWAKRDTNEGASKVYVDRNYGQIDVIVLRGFQTS